ncbi:MAG: flagellar motor protein MotB [Candidatus Latescibacterota bacterium]|nr:MAG: flagellar motor protein MotB [Candidatus Latescibacterota bacterium]
MKNASWILVISLVALLTVGCASKKVVREKDARIAELEGEMEGLQQQLAAAEQENAELNQKLEDALADYKAKEQVWLAQEESQSVVTVSEAVLFNSGSTTLSKTGMDVIDKIAEVAGGYANRPIIVEGHTDDVGIAAAYLNKYPSNWELASARACAVVHYLMKKHEMDPMRLSAVGFGEFRPLADNDTPEGRGKNRRVVLKIGAED